MIARHNTITRMTSQRRKILDYLRSVKTHPTAEMVYTALRKDLPSMTLATVYRNLNLLAEQGEILKFDVKCVSHFDGDLSFHQHCICSKCGRVKDLFEKKITSNTLRGMSITDFEPKSLNIIIYGTCQKCK